MSLETLFPPGGVSLLEDIPFLVVFKGSPKENSRLICFFFGGGGQKRAQPPRRKPWLLYRPSLVATAALLLSQDGKTRDMRT